MKPIPDITRMTRMEQHTCCTVAYSLLCGLLELAPKQVLDGFPDLDAQRKRMATIYESIKLGHDFSAGAVKNFRACFATLNEHAYEDTLPMEEQCREFAVWWCALLYFWLDAVKFAPMWTSRCPAEWEVLKRWIFETSDALAQRYGERVDAEGMGLYFRGYMALGHPRTEAIKWYLGQLEATAKKSLSVHQGAV